MVNQNRNPMSMGFGNSNNYGYPGNSMGGMNQYRPGSSYGGPSQMGMGGPNMGGSNFYG